jgi:hypothetical protein
MRKAATAARTTWAVLFALLLALRLLSPAGFMPAFEHGSVSIVICPDYEPPASPMAHHHHGGTKKVHAPCPFASASAVGAIGDETPWLVAALLLSAPLLLGRTFRFIAKHSSHERPPLRGPPLPA